jgi:hypothetical protein
MAAGYQVVGKDIGGFTNRILSESLFATRRCERVVSGTGESTDRYHLSPDAIGNHPVASSL